MARICPCRPRQQPSLAVFTTTFAPSSAFQQCQSPTGVDVAKRQEDLNGLEVMNPLSAEQHISGRVLVREDV
jgi:hypothetical protein